MVAPSAEDAEDDEEDDEHDNDDGATSDVDDAEVALALDTGQSAGAVGSSDAPKCWLK